MRNLLSCHTRRVDNSESTASHPEQLTPSLQNCHAHSLKTAKNFSELVTYLASFSMVGVIFRLRQTEICAQNWLFSVCLRRRYIHLNRYFPSETDGNKWPRNAIFHLAQMVPPIECDLGYRFPTRTLNPNPNPNLNPKTDPNRNPKPNSNPNPNPNTNPKSNKIYAVQNDTQIKFKIVL